MESMCIVLSDTSPLAELASNRDERSAAAASCCRACRRCIAKIEPAGVNRCSCGSASRRRRLYLKRCAPGGLLQRRLLLCYRAAAIWLHLHLRSVEGFISDVNSTCVEVQCHALTVGSRCEPATLLVTSMFEHWDAGAALSSGPAGLRPGH